MCVIDQDMDGRHFKIAHIASAIVTVCIHGSFYFIMMRRLFKSNSHRLIVKFYRTETLNFIFHVSF